jgi:hypothetical protein
MLQNKRTSKPVLALFSFFSIIYLTAVSSSTQSLAEKTSKAAAAAASTHSGVLEDAIKLKQTHFFMGSSVVTVAPNGIRLENTTQLKFVLVAKAPEWRVYVYRLDDKTYFSQSLKEFEQNGLMSNFCFPFKPAMFTGKRCTSETLSINGFKVVQLIARGEKLRYMDIVTLPIEVKKILYASYKMPTNGGIPVQYVYHVSGVDVVTGLDRKNEIENALDTTTMKRVKVSKQEFELPTGLTAINSMREVVAGNNTRNRDDDIKALLRM